MVCSVQDLAGTKFPNVPVTILEAYAFYKYALNISAGYSVVIRSNGSMSILFIKMLI